MSATIAYFLEHFIFNASTLILLGVFALISVMAAVAVGSDYSSISPDARDRMSHIPVLGVIAHGFQLAAHAYVLRKALCTALIVLAINGRSTQETLAELSQLDKCLWPMLVWFAMLLIFSVASWKTLVKMIRKLRAKVYLAQS